MTQKEDTENGNRSDQERRLVQARAAGLKTVLFVCTGNSIRSQMAEALVNHFLHDRWAAFSAGVLPAPIHPLVIQVLREIGIEIPLPRTKHLDLFQNFEFNLVVSLCADADRMCSFYPTLGRRLHLPFRDPLQTSLLGFGWKGLFRDLRDDMKGKLIPLLENLDLQQTE
jgi:arsenate reductase